MSQVKIQNVEHQHAGLSEPPTDEQMEFARPFRELLVTMADDGENSPEVKAFDKVLMVKYGSEILRAVQRSGGADETDDTEYSQNLDTNADPAGLKVVDPGGFQGMSLGQSLNHLVRTGRASQAEVTKMSLEPDRNKRIFIEARAPVPAGTYQDGRLLEEQEADAIYNRHFGKKK